MAQLGQAFDANTVAPNAPREILPPGEYLVQIVRSEMKETKNGAGQYLELEMAIMEGEHAERRLFDRLNLVNSNQQAADIANRTLSSICHATGVMNVSDSEQLHFRAMMAKVAVRPSGPDKSGTHREAQNEVKGYSAANGAKPRAAAQPAVASAGPSGNGAAKTAPWRRPAA